MEISFFQKRRSVGTQFQSVTVKDQSTQTNDIKLILPEKVYSTNESFNSTLMLIGSDDSRDQAWEPEIDSEVISMDFEDTESGKEAK